MKKVTALSILALAMLLSPSIGNAAAERMVHYYRCKPDFVVGRLWMRWIKEGSIAPRDIPNNSLKCTREQIWGGNICHHVIDIDQTPVSCTWSKEGTLAFSSPRF